MIFLSVLFLDASKAFQLSVLTGNQNAALRHQKAVNVAWENPFLERTFGIKAVFGGTNEIAHYGKKNS